MKLLRVKWAIPVNMCIITCDCGARFEHRADRMQVWCIKCGRIARLNVLREVWVHTQQQKRQLRRGR